jgi:Gram-negative bacterial TonB protein C-terminal
MQAINMTRLLRILTPLMLAGSLCFAQSSAKSEPSSIPPDAQAYLDRAAQAMLQRTAGNPAFHLKATFAATPAPNAGTLAAQETGSGTYEETWISPSQWRKDITFGSWHRTSGTEDGEKIWIVDTSPATPFPVSQLLQIILPNVTPTMYSHPPKWKMTDVRLGNVDLVRVGEASQQPRDGKRVGPEHAYYFVPENHVLLLYAVGMDATHFIKTAKLRDKLVLMAGTYVSPFFANLTFSIDSLTANPKADAALFAPPANARIVIPDKSGAHETIVKAKCISCPQPVYPQIAKTTHTTGTVVVQALIDSDGKVSAAMPVAGPPMLRQAGVDAVKSFHYEPIIIDGSPASMTVEINTVFTMN